MEGKHRSFYDNQYQIWMWPLPLQKYCTSYGKEDCPISSPMHKILLDDFFNAKRFVRFWVINAFVVTKFAKFFQNRQLRGIFCDFLNKGHFCGVWSRVSLNTFRPPVHFPIFPEGGGVGLQGFGLRGLGLQGFRARKARKRRRRRRFRKFQRFFGKIVA